jgi:lipopolysaccharide transport system ATP-binding protein
MAAPAIRVSSLGKRYRLGEGGLFRYKSLRETVASAFRSRAQMAEHWALKGLSFEVSQGEVVGVVGRNGAGKSTLLKVLAGITEPTEGFAEVFGRTGSLLEVGTGFHPELTGRENVYLNGAILRMSRAQIRQRFDSIVQFAEIEPFLDTPVKRYSTGMFMRLAFSVAAHVEPDILLVDEVLAVGDAKFQAKCLGKLSEISEGGRTVFFVSHNMAAVRAFCARALLLEGGRLVQDGPVDVVLDTYLGQVSTPVREFAEGPLRRVEVRVDLGRVTIVAGYAFEQAVPLPNFGFVVSDAAGTPVFGTNAIHDDVSPRSPAAQGDVEVVVESPVLRSGTYRLSVWLGSDAHADASRFPDCLTFDVIGGPSDRQPAALVGSARPACRWRFTADS